MTFKDVAINKDLIPQYLRDFADDGQVSEDSKGREIQYKFLKDNQKVLLIVYVKNKGLVTFRGAGQNPELAMNAANYVIENAQPIKTKNFNLDIPFY